MKQKFRFRPERWIYRSEKEPPMGQVLLSQEETIYDKYIREEINT